MLLSYIIPVYNTEKFIVKCLESILSQNISADEFEIIIINDGSTDNSLKIIDRWILDNPSINVISIIQENKGLSATRNVGILKANGKYIWFVDSDDYLIKNAGGKLLNEVVKNKLDVLWFDHQIVSIEGKILPLPIEDDKTGISEDVFTGSAFLYENFKTSCMACFFLIRRQFLISENLSFINGIYFEDIVFTPQMIFNSKRVKFSPLKAYNYLIREDSIMRNTDNIKKRIMDSLTVVKLLEEFSIEKNEKELFNYIDTFAGAILLYNYRMTLSLADGNFLKVFKTKLRSENLYPFKIKKPFKRKVLAKIANFSPFLFAKISKIRPIK